MLSVVARNFFKQGAVTATKMTKPAQAPTKAPMIMKSYLSHQSTLPKLPVPPLQQTLYKYLLAVQPLLSEDEYTNTKQIVEEFGKPGRLGESLQMKLVQRAQKAESWLSEWWLNVAYLDFRSPVVVNLSPGVAFPLQDFADQKEQLRFASKLIAGVLDYKVMVDSENLPIDMMGGQPLCMDQYNYKILSSCRIPGPKRDSVVVYPGNKANALSTSYFLIQFFTLDVYYPSGRPLGIDELFAQLEKIINMSTKRARLVGILTTEHRNTWGKVYRKLRKLDKANKKILEAIERSIFVLCLDEHTINVPVDQRLSGLACQMLHGGGSAKNSGNRWADKTLQFIVGREGNCGISCEHSLADGPPMVSMLDHSLTFIEKVGNVPKSAPINLPDPKRLEFKVNDELLQDIEIAEQHLDTCYTIKGFLTSLHHRMVDDLQVHAIQFKPFGKNIPKANRMSPDAFIQVALQLAYYRIYSQPTATYELAKSASMRRYRLGRTDAVRSCTIDSVNFCKAMLNEKKTRSEKYRLLRKAVEAHKTYTNEALFGDVIDRHLLGLKLTAIESGLNVPEIFTDPAYQIAMHFKLSTSQVPSKFDLVMCFGPAVPDGYGVYYNPQETHINFTLSAFNTSPERDPQKLAISLAASLMEMQQLTIQSEGSKLFND
ncbi:carnitine O-acetyltransferase-like [Ptychodera flava]|uniref:carnitine O-acetyltransferase-like n=1 Tax=Ptychodera flava TaxID=63121 RepID=UPI00396A8703